MPGGGISSDTDFNVTAHLLTVLGLFLGIPITNEGAESRDRLMLPLSACRWQRGCSSFSPLTNPRRSAERTSTHIDADRWRCRGFHNATQISGTCRNSRIYGLKRARNLEKYHDHEIIAICFACVRSITAAAVLGGPGFEHVCNLKGMLDWNDAKLPVEG